MRTRARGARQSAAAPSVSTKRQLEDLEAKRPRCAYCDDAPAIRLPIGLPEFDAPHFCSMICAAKAGIEAAINSGQHWCQDCKKWCGHDGNCAAHAKGGAA